MWSLMKILLVLAVFSIFGFSHAYSETEEIVEPLIIFDGEVCTKSLDEIDTTNLYRIARLDPENGENAYGEKGKNGVIILVSQEYGHPNLYSQFIRLKKSAKVCLIVAISFTVFLMLLIFVTIRRDSHHYVNTQTISDDKNASLFVRCCEGVIDRLILLPLLFGVFIWQLFTSFFLVENNVFLLFFFAWTLFSIVVVFAYYFFGEYLFGKTIGKWICRTHVILENEDSPTVKCIAKRTLARFIPYESISFLFTNIDKNGNMAYLWHDTLSNTRVVRDNPAISNSI